MARLLKSLPHLHLHLTLHYAWGLLVDLGHSHAVAGAGCETSDPGLLLIRTHVGATDIEVDAEAVTDQRWPICSVGHLLLVKNSHFLGSSHAWSTFRFVLIRAR